MVISALLQVASSQGPVSVLNLPVQMQVRLLRLPQPLKGRYLLMQAWPQGG